MIEEDIHKLCKKYHIKNYTINNDMSIDVDGNVSYLHNRNLTEIPLNFNRVKGDFDCSDNKLKSLKGAPNYVGVSFNCEHNELTSLIGCPKIVKDTFICNNNNLVSLDYCPDKLNGHFFCNDNNIKTLKNGPKHVSLIYEADNNNIRTFEGFIKVKYIFLNDNPIEELWYFFEDSNHIEYFNELDIIQENGDVIILDRLNYFLTDIGKKEITENDIENYIVK